MDDKRLVAITCILFFSVILYMRLQMGRLLLTRSIPNSKNARFTVVGSLVIFGQRGAQAPMRPCPLKRCDNNYKNSNHNIFLSKSTQVLDHTNRRTTPQHR
jgi:hypothetical protein